METTYLDLKIQQMAEELGGEGEKKKISNIFTNSIEFNLITNMTPILPWSLNVWIKIKFPIQKIP